MPTPAESSASSNPTHVDLDEAKQSLANLIDRVESGEDVVIDRGGRPSVRLTRVEQLDQHGGSLPPRELGSAVGQVWIAEDFGDPVPGFEDFYE